MSIGKLAQELGGVLTAQGVTEIFGERANPTSGQTLAILDFLKDDTMRTLIDPPKPPRQAAGNPGPKTLTEAREKIEVLEAQLLELRGSATAPKPASVPASPKAKAQPAGDPGADPAFPPINTPGADRLSPTPMPSGPKAPSITLSADLDSPVKIQAVLDKMNLGDLRLALNGTKDNLQIALLYRKIRARRELLSL